LRAGRDGDFWGESKGLAAVFVWSGHSCPLLLIFGAVVDFCNINHKIKNKVKGSGQECPLPKFYGGDSEFGGIYRVCGESSSPGKT
jgi:hypothetical protein